MRILYFYQYFTVPEGSYSTRVYEFTRRWVKAGDHVTVVTSVYDKSGITPKKFISRFSIEGVDVRMINVRLSNKHGILLRLVSFATYALLACWYAVVLPADVVVCSSGPLTVGLPGLVARYVRRRPLVFEVRDLWPEGAIQLGIVRQRVLILLARRFEGTCYRAASRIVALSEGMADWIKTHHQVQHVEVVENASDNELIDSLGGLFELPLWARGKHLVTYAGTLGLIDDCGQILDVANVVQYRAIPDVEFVIIGDGSERMQLEENARRLKLRNVHFLGLLPKANVMQWLRASCCSLFTVKDVPFLATASPNKVFDAFAAGVPVVQASQGWIKDLLAREHCGITVPPKNPTAMADAVLLLAHGNGLRSGLARHALRVARELFDRGQLAEKMRAIISSCLQSPIKRKVDR